MILSPVRVVVPKPVAETVSAEDEALVTASKMLPVAPPHAVRFEYGEVVPIPSLPLSLE